MRKILFSLALLMISAVPALAERTVLTVDGLTYECAYEKQGTVYRVDGKVVGTVKSENKRIIFLNAAGKPVGSAVHTKKGAEFYDQNGKLIAVQVMDDNPYAQDMQAVYYDAQGRVIGSAKGEGCFRMNFMDASGKNIGSSDTNALILRPFPLENWLLRQRAKSESKR